MTGDYDFFPSRNDALSFADEKIYSRAAYCTLTACFRKMVFILALFIFLYSYCLLFLLLLLLFYNCRSRSALTQCHISVGEKGRKVVYKMLIAVDENK